MGPLHDFQYGSFGGVTCAQIWADFLLWESVLNSNPQLTAIVELGTWQGGFSRYLYAQAVARGMEFATYDSVMPDNPPPGFIKTDIYRFADELGREFYEYGPIALLCDGGNKPRELHTFPPMLHFDSIVVVHDWGTETMPRDVPDFLTELYGDFCDQIRSISRVFCTKASSQ